jgi:thymidylate synthase ThyX
MVLGGTFYDLQDNDARLNVKVAVPRHMTEGGMVEGGTFYSLEEVDAATEKKRKEEVDAATKEIADAKRKDAANAVVPIAAATNFVWELY